MKRDTGQNRESTRNLRPATQAVRGGTARTEWGETSEAIFLTSGYSYDCAGDAAARFARTQDGMTYSRLQNPTVQMLEARIALLEGAEACRTTPEALRGGQECVRTCRSRWATLHEKKNQDATTQKNKQTQ